MDITITLSDADAKMLGALDAKRDVPTIVQVHVETWLAPLRVAVEHHELGLLQAAYAKADGATRTKVREELLARAEGKP